MVPSHSPKEGDKAVDTLFECAMISSVLCNDYPWWNKRKSVRIGRGRAAVTGYDLPQAIPAERLGEGGRKV